MEQLRRPPEEWLELKNESRRNSSDKFDVRFAWSSAGRSLCLCHGDLNCNCYSVKQCYTDARHPNVPVLVLVKNLLPTNDIPQDKIPVSIYDDFSQAISGAAFLQAKECIAYMEKQHEGLLHFSNEKHMLGLQVAP